MSRAVWRHGYLVTLSGERGWHCIRDGALIVENGSISWLGPDHELPASQKPDVEYDLHGAFTYTRLSGLPHPLGVRGDRTQELERRLLGESYAQIAANGGGIRSTVFATRSATEQALLSLARDRMNTMRSHGVTTLEIKSGYGLTLDHEARCLRVARQLGTERITIKTTCLAAHTTPDEYSGRANDYVDAVCEWLPTLKAHSLLDAVDVFCDAIAFTPAQAKQIFMIAKSLGIPIKIHAEQLTHQGGAELAAEFKALSCDHLEWLSENGIAAMRKAGTTAVLLPGAYYFTGETKLPPIASLRAAGVPLAIASDHNPGTSPVLSMQLIMNMACILFRMTPEEALRGATVNGARALGLSDRGSLAVGKRGDLAIWNVNHPQELMYWAGANLCRQVIVAGLPVSTLTQPS